MPPFSPAHPLRILFLGAFYPFHGLDCLLRAFAAGRYLTAPLYLVGPGPEDERASLVRLAEQLGTSERVHFLTGLADAEVYGALRAADVLALPYLDHERNAFNFPTKLIEYLWAGKPILASTVGEISLVLKDGENALLLPPGDVAAWASALSDLLADSTKREALGKGARRLYESEFAPEAVRARLNSFLVR